jgi:hypothetical protein
VDEKLGQAWLVDDAAWPIEESEEWDILAESGSLCGERVCVAGFDSIRYEMEWIGMEWNGIWRIGVLGPDFGLRMRR